MVTLQKSLVNQIYDILRERITSFSMKPGSRIDVEALSNEFDVSPTPIKSALRILLSKGLVTGGAGRGFFVVTLSVKKLEEIYDLRKLLEIFALKEAFERISHKDLLEIREEMEDLKQGIKEGIKPIEYYRKQQIVQDRNLHLKIVEGSGNQTLQDFYFQIYDFVKISQWLYESTLESLEEHTALIDTILDHDFTKAKAILEKHINRARTRAINALESKASSDRNAS